MKVFGLVAGGLRARKSQTNDREAMPRNAPSNCTE